MHYDRIEIVLLGVPKAKQSVRTGQNGHHYQDSATNYSQTTLRALIIQQIMEKYPGFEPWQNGVRINKALFEFPKLKSWSKSKASEPWLYKTTKPDLHDNLFKMTIDAMTGVIFRDDAQICQMNCVMKLFGDRPRIELTLSEITKEECG